MLLVKTRVKESQIHGLGLFADQFIPKGTVIFKESVFTKKFTEQEYQEFPELQKDFINTYCYFLGGVWRCSLDNDRFMNHSDTPNTFEPDFETTVALSDINVGEEITTNYNEIEIFEKDIKFYWNGSFAGHSHHMIVDGKLIGLGGIISSEKDAKLNAIKILKNDYGITITDSEIQFEWGGKL